MMRLNLRSPLLVMKMFKPWRLYSSEQLADYRCQHLPSKVIGEMAVIYFKAMLDMDCCLKGFQIEPVFELCS